MIEAYAFLAIFTIQILTTSVLYPAWLIRYVRATLLSYPAERFAVVFPGFDRGVSAERFATRHRALNTGIALLGLLLLGWLFSYMRRVDWRVGPVEGLTVGFCLLQWSPLLILAIRSTTYNKVLKHSLAQEKRKAVLQRRGLFDFISPFVVLLAALSYLVFAALVICRFPARVAVIEIGAVTLTYALNVFVGYRSLYGRKRHPMVTHADRVRSIGKVVSSVTYSCIAITVYLSLSLTLLLLHLDRWEPFALSFFFVVCTLLASMAVIAPPRRPDADGFSASGPLPPGKALS